MATPAKAENHPSAVPDQRAPGGRNVTVHPGPPGYVVEVCEECGGEWYRSTDPTAVDEGPLLCPEGCDDNEWHLREWEPAPTRRAGP